MTQRMVKYGIIGLVFFCIMAAVPCYADFLNSITESLSKAGEVISETTSDVVDGAAEAAKSVGEEVGLIDKEEKIEAPPKKKTSSAASSTTNTASSPAKLPGGVKSRIEKMYTELDKVEKKLVTGVGTPVDRAKRAELDLKRARGFMKEIESRYKGQYSLEDPVVSAAAKRLSSVESKWKQAMNIASAEETEAQQTAEAEQQAEEAEKKQLAQQQDQEQQEKKGEQQASEEACRDWSEKFEAFMGGDKGLTAYATDDNNLIDKWRKVYGEARETVKDYPQGLCPRADSVAEYVQNKLVDFEAIDQAAKAQAAQAKKDEGGFYFSTEPFKDPAGGQVQESFEAGDHIYGIIRMTQKWSEIYKKKKDFSIRIDVKIDGNGIHAQFVTIKSSEYAQRDYLIFDVAPALSELTAYSDPNIEYGKTTASIVQGPNELTHHLGSLSSGSHKVAFSVYYYGKIWAEGQFSVAGDDFSKYSELHGKIATGVVSARTLPAAKMSNKNIEKQMESLLKNAGWDNVYRLNIVDKDWWIERTNGGNTPVKARYLAAAALTKKADGSYAYKKCTFHQDKLITGNFGELYLSHQGEEVVINKDNIDK